jgi:hypothetical protein
MLLGQLGFLIIESTLPEFLNLAFTQGPLEHRRIYFLGILLINGSQPQNSVSIDMYDDFDRRLALLSRWDLRQFKCSQNMVVLDQLILALVDSHEDHLLVVLGGGEGVLSQSRDGAVSGEEDHH